jgi:hypothetical protein
MTAATRHAGALAQRDIKLSPLRQAAARHKAAGRIGNAEAMQRLTARLETAEPELWLTFGPAEIDQLLEISR